MRTRSPFPGMDPWLERYWSDIHHRLITTFADQIQDQLPRGLYASIEVTVYISDEEDNQGKMIPDVGVFNPDSNGAGNTRSASQSNIAVATPYRIKLPAGPIEEGHVVIRSLEDHDRLVTVIEVLSPTNKVDRRGRDEYKQKREQYYNARANLVEIDLLRRGMDLVDVPFEEVPERLITPYKAVVRPAHPHDETEAEYYAIPLREPLPRILIPLRRNDPDVILDFQEAITSAYLRGRYGERIKYDKPPAPPLDPDDALWASALIAGAQQ